MKGIQISFADKGGYSVADRDSDNYATPTDVYLTNEPYELVDSLLERIGKMLETVPCARNPEDTTEDNKLSDKEFFFMLMSDRAEELHKEIERVRLENKIRAEVLSETKIEEI